MPEEWRSRHLAWDACYNARDVGGYPTENGGQIRWRPLVRADNLNRLTEDGQAALRDYGLRTIIDLRLADELERYPNPWASQQRVEGAPRYLHLPLHYAEDTEAIDDAAATGEEYVVILERSKPLV